MEYVVASRITGTCRKFNQQNKAHQEIEQRGWKKEQSVSHQGFSRSPSWNTRYISIVDLVIFSVSIPKQRVKKMWKGYRKVAGSFNLFVFTTSRKGQNFFVRAHTCENMNSMRQKSRIWVYQIKSNIGYLCINAGNFVHAKKTNHVLVTSEKFCHFLVLIWIQLFIESYTW